VITATALSQGKYRPPAGLKELRDFLQAALEVEHFTVPVYMSGMYSIRPGANRFSYDTIRSVLMEEMLHLTLAANLLNAVGGTPDVARPGFVAGYPARLPFSSRSLPEIPLQNFSPAALDTFLLIERPRALVPPAGGEAEDDEGWTSIGQFYDAIRKGLIALEREQREQHRRDPAAPATLFTGDPRRQVGPTDFYNSGGEAFPVTDLKSALLAVEVISDQGEGVADTIWDSDDIFFGEQRQVAHYFRFKEIRVGRRYGAHDLPRTGPSGPLLDVVWDEAYRIDPRAKVAHYPEGSQVRAQAEFFNRTYAHLLALLQLAFTGDPWVMRQAVPVMLELRDLSQRLYRNPHPDRARAAQGIHASPTFELTEQHFVQARADAAAKAAASPTPEEQHP